MRDRAAGSPLGAEPVHDQMVSRPRAAVTEAGAAAGIVGGVVMAAFEMVYAYLEGGNAVAPLQAIAGTFYGPAALIGGGAVVVWGTLLHLAVASALGVAFAWIVGPYPRGGAAFGWGLAYGFAAMIAMTYFVLPWANPTMFERVPLMMGAWVAGHLIYGVCLAAVPGYIRRS
jgi:hypothetical protein